MIKFLTDKNIVLRSIACGIIVATVLQITCFAGMCDDLTDRVLRLHIIANSDSAEDQNLKLYVRDCLLEVGNGLFDGVTSENQAEEIVGIKMDVLQKTAENAVKNKGYNYPVSVSIENTDFETRKYETATLPAGKYRALRVVIGKGEGKNWWCIMFPPMCLPAAQENSETLDGVLTDGELERVENADEYQLRFKIVEIYNKLSRRIKGSD